MNSCEVWVNNNRIRLNEQTALRTFSGRMNFTRISSQPDDSWNGHAQFLIEATRCATRSVIKSSSGRPRHLDNRSGEAWRSKQASLPKMHHTSRKCWAISQISQPALIPGRVCRLNVALKPANAGAKKKKIWIWARRLRSYGCHAAHNYFTYVLYAFTLCTTTTQ